MKHCSTDNGRTREWFVFVPVWWTVPPQGSGYNIVCILYINCNIDPNTNANHLCLFVFCCVRQHLQWEGFPRYVSLPGRLRVPLSACYCLHFQVTDSAWGLPVRHKWSLNTSIAHCSAIKLILIQGSCWDAAGSRGQCVSNVYVFMFWK